MFNFNKILFKVFINNTTSNLNNGCNGNKPYFVWPITLYRGSSFNRNMVVILLIMSKHYTLLNIT